MRAVASAVYAKEFWISSVQLRLWEDLTVLTKQNLVSKGITMGVIYVYNVYYYITVYVDGGPHSEV